MRTKHVINLEQIGFLSLSLSLLVYKTIQQTSNQNGYKPFNIPDVFVRVEKKSINNKANF